MPRVKADERARRDALVWQMFLAGVSYREIGKNPRVQLSCRGGSRSVLDTSTSLAPASALTRAPMCTAIPPMSSPRTSHSPVCNPART